MASYEVKRSGYCLKDSARMNYTTEAARKNRQIAKLNNICWPRIMSDIELKSKLLSIPSTTKVQKTKVTTVESDQNKTSLEFVVPENEW